MNNQAELISVGSELLTGQTVNTHARDLGAALSALGLRLMRDTTVPDEIDTIVTTIHEAFERVPLLFISGGLGPTSDDLTRTALMSYFKRPVVCSREALEAMAIRYATFGRAMTPAAERQALILEGAVVLLNSAGAAPGERIDLPHNKTLFVLPGPPNEFNAILNEAICPWIKTHYAETRPQTVRVAYTVGIGESDIVMRLEGAGFAPEKVEVGFYPGQGKVRIRLAANAENEQDLFDAETSLRRMLSDFLEPQ